jgi:hypothetical protein
LTAEGNPVAIAATHGHWSIIKLALDKGVQLKMQDPVSALNGLPAPLEASTRHIRSTNSLDCEMRMRRSKFSHLIDQNPTMALTIMRILSHGVPLTPRERRF